MVILLKLKVGVLIKFFLFGVIIFWFLGWILIVLAVWIVEKFLFILIVVCNIWFGLFVVIVVIIIVVVWLIGIFVFKVMLIC